MAQYKRLRLAGKLQVDRGWQPDLLVERNPDGRTFIWGETDLTRKFQDEFKNEQRLTTSAYSYGPADSDFQYKGSYSDEDARDIIKTYYGKVPEGCRNFTGTYNCLFYDDNITQKVEFEIGEEAWQKWVPRLKEIAQENSAADVSLFENNRLYINFNPSTGSRDLEFRNGKVFFTRMVHD